MLGGKGLSVRDVAQGMIPRLEGIWGRKMVDLGVGGAGREGEEVEVAEFRRMCEVAEEEASNANLANGGWRTEPDLSGRI